MNDISPTGIRKFSKHVLECRAHSRQLPKELSELQDYLQQLSSHVKRYERIKGSMGRDGECSSRGVKPREMSFSVRESIEESPGVQVIEMTPPEVVTVISGRSKAADEEGEFASAVSSPEVASLGKASSDESVIGIYFINDVKPANMINVIQRELCALGRLYPNAGDIIGEITCEFEHFKACCVCLKKVTPLLADILKELQELIKFIKKKRNEPYVWPNDSEYLRKKPEGQSEPFKRDQDKKNVREETVGYLTVHTKLPDIIRETEKSILGGHPECIRRCSVRLSNRQQLTLLQSEAQSDLRILEKAETVDKGNDGERSREILRPTELSTAQVSKNLNPVPVVETALQYRLGRNCGAEEESKIREFTSKEEEIKNSLASKAKEFLLTARVALGEACMELQGDMGKVRMENDIKTYVKDLRDLMLEVHRNQIELSKVLLEKGFLSPAVVQFTDPGMLLEEREGMRMAKDSFAEAKLDNPEIERLQFLVEELKAKCKIKNKMIMALLKGVKSNIPRHHCEEMVNTILQETESVQQMGPEKGLTPLESCSSAKEWKKLDVEEMAAGKNLGRGVINTARISYSEVISKSKMLYHETPTRAQSFNKEELEFESGELTKELENDTNYPGAELKKLEYEAPDRRPGYDELRRERSGSATINLTIKIGDEDLRSRYLSALSVAPSGAALIGKESEISLPERAGSSRARSFSVGGFASACDFPQETGNGNNLKSLALKFKLPLMFKDETGGGRFNSLSPAQYPKSNERSIPTGLGNHNIPEDLTVAGRSPSCEMSPRASRNDFSGSDVSILYPQMDGHCEQTRAMKALRSRLIVLEDDLRSLRMTIDRMSVLTDKLVDDAYESSQNFREIFNCYRFTSDYINN